METARELDWMFSTKTKSSGQVLGTHAAYEIHAGLSDLHRGRQTDRSSYYRDLINLIKACASYYQEIGEEVILYSKVPMTLRLHRETGQGFFAGEINLSPPVGNQDAYNITPYLKMPGTFCLEFRSFFDVPYALKADYDDYKLEMLERPLLERAMNLAKEILAVPPGSMVNTKLRDAFGLRWNKTERGRVHDLTHVGDEFYVRLKANGRHGYVSKLSFDHGRWKLVILSPDERTLLWTVDVNLWTLTEFLYASIRTIESAAAYRDDLFVKFKTKARG